jgi:vanillate O-demethylase ferredoxin subunit
MPPPEPAAPCTWRGNCLNSKETSACCTFRTTFTAGAHVDLRLPSGAVRSYSLRNDPSVRDTYRLGVQLAVPSKGGSAEVHAALHIGQLIRLSSPTNDFEVDETVEFTVLIAGGIGITPLMAMAYRMKALGRSFVLHYTCRTADKMAFCDELAERLGGSLKVYVDTDDQRFDARTALADVSRSSALYLCGPNGFVTHVESVAAGLGWSPSQIRKECFGHSVNRAGQSPAA